ncbi:glutaredoxin family protein [Pseudoxanthomonas sp. LjRoot168]|uniref:glutaredoxin family protein n=1 Tax=unclassified Pseudoxanthomonas TaxID=2645906 RepID=UPI003ECFBEF1
MKRMLPVAVVAISLLIGIGAGRAYNAHKLAKSSALVITHGEYSLYLARPEQVAFYSLASCGGCKKTRQLLRELGVDYVERPADNLLLHRQELHRLDAERVPVIVTANSKLEGYDRDKIISLLRTQGYILSAEH